MTQISQIIIDAFRESDLLEETNYPTPTQMGEALRRLNTLFTSLFGYEVGEQLRDVNLGSSDTTHDQLELESVCEVTQPPANVRLVMQEGSAQTVYLPSNPEDGARIGIYDPFSRLATANVTLNGNGRLIEAAPTLVLDVNGTQRIWMYRSDIANWVRITGLTDASEDMPFPEEFDDYFVTSLAVRLNPRWKRGTTQETMVALDRMKKHLQSRYRQHRQVGLERSLWINPWSKTGLFDGNF